MKGLLAQFFSIMSSFVQYTFSVFIVHPDIKDASLPFRKLDFVSKALDPIQVLSDSFRLFALPSLIIKSGLPDHLAESSRKFSEWANLSEAKDFSCCFCNSICKDVASISFTIGAKEHVAVLFPLCELAACQNLANNCVQSTSSMMSKLGFSADRYTSGFKLDDLKTKKSSQCELSSCGKTGKWKQCNRCRCAMYCSRECQVADWSGHKLRCKLLNDFRENGKMSTKIKKTSALLGVDSSS